MDGWGGPPRGGVSNSKTGKAGPGRPKGVKDGEGKAAKARDNRTGGGTAWMPGNLIPGRTPNFGNAIGRE